MKVTGRVKTHLRQYLTSLSKLCFALKCHDRLQYLDMFMKTPKQSFPFSTHANVSVCLQFTPALCFSSLFNVLHAWLFSSIKPNLQLKTVDLQRKDTIVWGFFLHLLDSPVMNMIHINQNEKLNLSQMSLFFLLYSQWIRFFFLVQK